MDAYRISRTISSLLITGLLAAMAMPATTADEPYVSTTTYHGSIDWAAAWHAEVPGEGCVVGPDVVVLAPKTCGGFRGGGSIFGEVATNVTADVATIIVELDWEPTVPGTTLQLDAFCDEVPRSGSGSVLDPDHPCYNQTEGTAPLQIRIDADDWAGGEYDPIGDWASRVFGSAGTVGSPDDGLGVGAVYEQPFTLYITLWHGIAAPDGYSAIP